MFSWYQRSALIVGKLRQSDMLPMSGCPASSSANNPSQKRMVSSSLASSMPAARQVSSVASTMNVEMPFRSSASLLPSSTYW